MAGQWCTFSVILSVLVILIVNSTYAQISDVNVNYFAYKGTIASSSRDIFEFKPLVRLRRDDNPKDEKDGEKSTVTGKKSTVPTKKPKAVKVSAADNSQLKPADNPPPAATAEAADNQSSNATANITISITTTTTTSTTTTSTTTTSSPPTTNSVPITTTTSESSAGNPSPEGASSKNSTAGAMPAESVPESTTAGSSQSNVTNVATAEPNTDVNAYDPDSGGDDFETKEGDFDTKNTTIDHHRYYKSVTVKDDGDAQRYWVNLDELSEEKVVTSEMLSHSHRRAATVTLTFDFPFYGHMLKNITIATGGFLFTGDFVHTWLAATQYIAPLMANFDTSVSEDACIKYADNGTAFTVQWDKVKLKDHLDAGTFTFQATLHQTGDIAFTYKQIPVTVTNIGDDQHPVKVGLSDAYIVDRTIFYVRRKTIYEYHKIDMKKSSLIGNWTAIIFKALPTCMNLTTCEACLSTDISFQCNWCNKLGRCSTGLDRHRQDWLYKGCENHSVQEFAKCAGLIPPTPPSAKTASSGNGNIDTFGQNASVEPYTKAPGSPVLDTSDYKKGIVTDGEPETLAHTSGREGSESGSGAGGVVAVIFILGLVLGVGGWVAYAYFYPHSTSGQILIKYRPSTWSWRRGEARYTAASIHSIHM